MAHVLALLRHCAAREQCPPIQPGRVRRIASQSCDVSCTGSAACLSVQGLPREPWLKRPFDFFLALLGLIVSTPLWAVVAVAIWLEDGRPIFYTQERIGRGGRRFNAWKFRSMNRNAELGTGPIAAAENDPRITKVGKALRTTGMDELPQLVNILKGDMSFVGPRADRPWEQEDSGGNFVGEAADGNSGTDDTKSVSDPTRPQIPDLDFRQLIPGYETRLVVRPGLTGLAQVYGSYDTPRRQKLRYDRLYVENMSVWLDIRLILLSFWITMHGRWESRTKKL